MEEERLEENQNASLIYIYPLPEGQIDDPQKGRLFLSGKEAALDMDFIRSNKIKAVLTLTAQSNPQYSEEDNIDHLMIDVEDSTTYNIEKDFDKTFDFIDRNLQKGNLLIHCEKGISRSPTIAIAFIMRKEKKIFSQVLNLVRRSRNIVSPNGGFYYHLEKYNKTLKETYSEDYSIHNLTKPTHQHNENCIKQLTCVRNS